MITSELYRSGPTAIRRIVQGIEHFLNSKGFASIADLCQARPKVMDRPQFANRRGYLESLTRSEKYTDPTPVAEQQTGDRYGHKN